MKNHSETLQVCPRLSLVGLLQLYVLLGSGGQVGDLAAERQQTVAFAQEDIKGAH